MVSKILTRLWEYIRKHYILTIIILVLIALNFAKILIVSFVILCVLSYIGIQLIKKPGDKYILFTEKELTKFDEYNRTHPHNQISKEEYKIFRDFQKKRGDNDGDIHTLESLKISYDTMQKYDLGYRNVSDYTSSVIKNKAQSIINEFIKYPMNIERFKEKLKIAGLRQDEIDNIVVDYENRDLKSKPVNIPSTLVPKIIATIPTKEEANKNIEINKKLLEEKSIGKKTKDIIEAVPTANWIEEVKKSIPSVSNIDPDIIIPNEDVEKFINENKGSVEKMPDDETQKNMLENDEILKFLNVSRYVKENIERIDVLPWKSFIDKYTKK